MTSLLRAGLAKPRRTASKSSSRPTCILVVPFFHAAPQTLAGVADSSLRRASTCIGIVRLEDGLIISLQLRYRASDATSPVTEKPSHWEIVTMAAGTSAKVLYSTYRKAAVPQTMKVIVVPFLRFQCVAVSRKGSSASARVIDPGLSSARKGSQYKFSTLEKLLQQDAERLTAARTRSAAIMAKKQDGSTPTPAV